MRQDLFLSWLTRRFAGPLLLAMTTLAPVQAAELLMFDRPGCVWCQRWEAEIGPIYPKTDEGRRFPLRHVNVEQPLPADIKLDPPVRYTPTFVLVDDGKELGRITGYIGDDAFWSLLSMMVAKLDKADAGRKTN